MKILKTMAAAAAFTAAVSSAPAVFAVDEYNVPNGTTVGGHGVAVRGNDVVALATGLDVTSSQARYTHVHDGVAYYFSSKATKQRFAADPSRYMPQFGGFCALGVALGKKLDGSPRYADIVDGKLYVFVNDAVFQKYKEDKPGTLANARMKWPGMRSVAVAEVNS